MYFLNLIRCGITMNQNDLKNHAKETGHTSFVENVTLSEEEKQKQLIKLAEKIKQKRIEREAFEREEELLREKHRIKSGKEIIAAKKRYRKIISVIRDNHLLIFTDDIYFLSKNQEPC